MAEDNTNQPPNNTSTSQTPPSYNNVMEDVTNMSTERSARSDVERKFHDNGLCIPHSFEEDEDLEYVSSYYRGGNLPVQIGSIIGQYKVIHKLAISSESISIWLCQDTEEKVPKYYALKTLPADAPQDSPELWIGTFYKSIYGIKPDVHLMLPIKYIALEGPFGWHEAILYPVWGPPMTALFPLRSDEDGERVLRKMSWQITHALHTLHASGLCHGAFTIDKIFAGICGLDGRVKEDILNDSGWPDIVRVFNKETGEEHKEKFAPSYLVRTITWEDLNGEKIDITDDAYVTDFGQAFVISDPPQSLGNLGDYSSPEWMLDKEVGQGSDVWGFGCVLFEMRTGKHIFQCGGPEIRLLIKQCLILGRMPEPWWSQWKERKGLLEDGSNEVIPTENWIRLNGKQIGPRSIKEALETVFDDIRPEEGDEVPRPLDKEEIELFSDLLRKIFKWKPKDRITLKEAIAHPYFRYKAKEVDIKEMDRKTDVDRYVKDKDRGATKQESISKDGKQSSDAKEGSQSKEGNNDVKTDVEHRNSRTIGEQMEEDDDTERKQGDT